MKLLLKRVIVIEMEILESETEPKHYQTTQRVLNEYDPEIYKQLFNKLNVIERTYAEMKTIVGDFKETKEELLEELNKSPLISVKEITPEEAAKEILREGKTITHVKEKKE